MKKEEQKIEVQSGDIKLTGKDQFAKDWNKISDLFQIWKETDTQDDFDNYLNAKVRLEQGLPV